MLILEQPKCILMRVDVLRDAQLLFIDNYISIWEF